MKIASDLFMVQHREEASGKKDLKSIMVSINNCSY